MMMFLSCNLSYIAQICVLLLFVVVFRGTKCSGGPLKHSSVSHWRPATATWYGSPEGDGSNGGACGYGSLVDVKPFKARVGAVSPILFKGGEGCGACYKVKTPCKYPGKNIAFHVNEGSTNYWLSLLVEFEDGDGDVGSMQIREDQQIIGFHFWLNSRMGTETLDRCTSESSILVVIMPAVTQTIKQMADNKNSISLTELNRKSNNWAKIVDEIIRIEKKIFPKHESLAKSFDDELKKKNSGLIYFEIHGDVGGYVMYSCPSSLSSVITKLAVKEQYRRQGHGEALVKAAIEKCRSKRINRVSLHVDPLRTSAMQLYNKLGFQIDTLVKGYYSSDRDAYRMFIEFDSE
nr:N-alpha-acetyltransferase 10-like [Tanacetum cinerariifolium]